MILKLWLLVWGILAFLALAAPGLVVLGLFLILPGFILLAAPTVFLYSALFALARLLLPFPTPARDFLAVVAALSFGWLAAQPAALTARRNFHRANLPEVVPSSPVPLAGHIRLELPKEPRRRREAPTPCGGLCAALLDTPGVSTVTVAIAGNPPATFRLIPRTDDRSHSLHPLHPEEILPDPPDPEDRQAVAAAWALRLASRQKLIAESASPSPDLLLRITQDRRKPEEISVSRVELLNSQGRALFRRSFVTATALAAPLHFTGTGDFASYRVHLARVPLHTAPASPDWHPIPELFRYTALARPPVDPHAVTALLGRLNAALQNPALPAEDADFALASLWLPTLNWNRPLPHHQLTLLARLLADERVPLAHKPYEGYESKASPELRTALASRIRMPSTAPAMRTHLARLLARLPESTFAKLSPVESGILNSSALRLDAYPLIVRLADQGESAVPQLLAILEQDSGIQPSGRRMRVMEAVATAFAILGPKAATAIPVLDPQVSIANSPLMANWKDRKLWYLALARMGKPINDFRWFNDKPERIARERANLQRQLDRFDPHQTRNF